MGKQKRAPKNVGQGSGTTKVKIKSIRYIGKEDVYNMEVDRHHNYSVNGGFIIHNCDAMRYFCMKVLRPKEDINNGVQMYKDF